MVVECRVDTEGELNGTLSFFESLPHDSIALYAGEGGSFNVLITNETRLGELSSGNCTVTGPKKTGVVQNETEREKLMGELRAFRELERVIQNPEEREFIHNRTLDLECTLGLKWKVKPRNVTLATVNIIYPKPHSNVPFMVLLWTGAGVSSIGELGAFKNASRKVGSFFFHNESSTYEMFIRKYELESRIIEEH